MLASPIKHTQHDQPATVRGNPTHLDFDERQTKTIDGRHINYFVHMSPEAAQRKQRNDPLDVLLSQGKVNGDQMMKAAVRKTPIVISNHLKDLMHKKKALDANHHNIFDRQARVKKQ